VEEEIADLISNYRSPYSYWTMLNTRERYLMADLDTVVSTFQRAGIDRIMVPDARSLEPEDAFRVTFRPFFSAGTGTNYWNFR
jgi:hypothetical protein